VRRRAILCSVIGLLMVLAVLSVFLRPPASVAETPPRPAAAEPPTFTSYDELAGYIKRQTALS